MDRREILQATGLAAVTTFAGCLDTDLGTTSEPTDEPTPGESAAYKAPIRDLWAAYNDENVTGMRAAYHPDSPEGVAEDDVNFGNEVTLTGFSVVDRSDGELTVEANATVTENGDTETVTHTYELRRHDGDWAVWRFTVGPAGSDDDSTTESGPNAPAVVFAFDYDGSVTESPDTGVLTITHNSGDTIDAATLSIHGNGIVNPAGARPDVTAAGTTWADATGVTSVTAGTDVTVGVASDCEVSLVWSAAEGGTSAVLADYDGSDA